MLNDFKNWVESVAGPGYRYVLGQWVESAMDTDAQYCVIQLAGGPRPDVDDRRPRYRVVLIGRRGRREDAVVALATADDLVAATLGDSRPCVAARVGAVGEPAGPGYTTENRAWVQATFEVLI